MKPAAALTTLLVSVALGLALAGKDINIIEPSPELQDLDTVDTKGDASFSASEKTSKDKSTDLAPLTEVLAPPAHALLSALSVPPVDNLLSATSTPPTSPALTAVSGTPVATPDPAKDLKDIADKIIVFSPPLPESEKTVVDQDKKDDKLKKPDMIKDDKDLEVPVYAFSFASPPKESLDKDLKDKLKALLGRRMF